MQTAAYRVQLQEPLRSRFVEIHEDLIVGETELLEDNMYAVGPPTAQVLGCISRAPLCARTETEASLMLTILDVRKVRTVGE